MKNSLPIKKILILSAAFPPRGKGGGPAASYFIAKGLKDAGYEIQVITVGDHAGTESYKGIELTVIKSPNIYWDYLHHSYPAWKKIIWHLLENFNPIAYFKSAALYKKFKPDAVVTISVENVNVSSWLSAKRFGVPVIHFAQSYFLCCWKGSLFKNCQNCTKQCFDCKVMSSGKKLMSKNVDVVIGETHFILEQHKELGYFNHALTFKIPGPIENIELDSIKKKNGPLVVGYMGVLEQHKGLDVLADAASKIGADAGIHFMIAGTSRTDHYLTQLKKRFGSSNVSFLGWVSSEQTYPKFDVLVVPSLWKEPFGRIVVEAMAYGIPIIAAKSGGITENISHGENGFLYEPNNHEELATFIKKLSQNENLRYEMALNSKKSSAGFNYENFVGQLKECFNDLLENEI